MTVLNIEVPDDYVTERNYVFGVVFDDWLGCKWRMQQIEGRTIRITCGDSAAVVSLPDVFFQTPQEQWLTDLSLPRQPLRILSTGDLAGLANVTAPTIPIIYGDADSTIACKPEGVWLPIDVFGSAFFMLTRYEELVNMARDEHERFPAGASLALKESFLLRPVIDEYVELLWAAMRSLWPWLERRKRRHRLNFSCDVDQPVMRRLHSAQGVFRQMAGDLMKRRSFSCASMTLRRYMAIKRYGDEHDPFFTFDWMLDCLEAHGVRGAFYFMSDHNSKVDGDYALNEPRIRRLMRRIYERGHEIGLHPSYNTLGDPVRLQSELRRLMLACGELGIVQDRWGGRQHYLRWRACGTWRHWAEAGLDYDATLGFADHIGFRAGTLHEFLVFDLRHRKPLSLRERPLALMEETVFSKSYMNISGYQMPSKVIGGLINTCKKMGGPLNLLWHNSSLTTAQERQLFKEVVSAFCP
jgi:Family of unknown function (DUF7033)